MTPLFTHDCTGCVYLGTIEWQENKYDLYFCKQSLNWPTVIARYSPDGPDYMSGLQVAMAIEADPHDDHTHPLVEAMHRAKQRGLLTRKETSL